MEIEITRRDAMIGTTSFLIGGGSGYLLGNSGAKNKNRGNDENNSKNSLEHSLTTNNRPYKGNLDASIQVVYWLDYKCPYCTRFSDNAMEDIESNYIKTGDISFVYKPLAVIKETSIYGALAAHCVFEQGVTKKRFSKWTSDLMTAYVKENRSGTPTQIAVEVSKSYDVNTSKLRQCIENQTYKSRILKDQQEAKSWGFSGTPYFLIYNKNTFKTKTIVGNQPFSAFENAIKSLQSK